MHLGKNAKTGQEVAIKMELQSCKEPQLPLEYSFFKILGTGIAKGIPKCFYFGACPPYHALVMDLLGPNLEKMHEKCDRKFSLRTTAQLAIQLFSIFEYFHGKRLIYRDTKPENFLLGLTDTDNYNVVHIIDFGLCKEYKDIKGRHVPNGDARLTTGTIRYMSINNHMVKEQSRKFFIFQRDIIEIYSLV